MVGLVHVLLHFVEAVIVDHIVGVFLHFHNALAQCVEGLAQCDGGGDGTCGSPHAVVQNIAAHTHLAALQIRSLVDRHIGGQLTGTTQLIPQHLEACILEVLHDALANVALAHGLNVFLRVVSPGSLQQGGAGCVAVEGAAGHGHGSGADQHTGQRVRLGTGGAGGVDLNDHAAAGLLLDAVLELGSCKAPGMLQRNGQVELEHHRSVACGCCGSSSGSCGRGGSCSGAAGTAACGQGCGSSCCANNGQKATARDLFHGKFPP